MQSSTPVASPTTAVPFTPSYSCLSPRLTLTCEHVLQPAWPRWVFPDWGRGFVPLLARHGTSQTWMTPTLFPLEALPLTPAPEMLPVIHHCGEYCLKCGNTLACVSFLLTVWHRPLFHSDSLLAWLHSSLTRTRTVEFLITPNSSLNTHSSHHLSATLLSASLCL